MTGIGKGRGGRTDLTEEDRPLLARIRQLDDLRIEAHTRRDQMIIEAAMSGIKYGIIGAAAGGVVQSTISHIINHPFDRILNNHKSGPKSYKRRIGTMKTSSIVANINKALRQSKIPFVVIVPVDEDQLANNPNIADQVARKAERRMRKLVEDRQLFGEEIDSVGIRNDQDHPG